MKQLFVLRVIAALMLLIALGDHPYAYYQLLRWVVCGVSAYGALTAYERKDTVWTWLFGVTAVVFNPIMPFYLDRETWQVLDIAAALILLVSLAAFRLKKSNV